MWTKAGGAGQLAKISAEEWCLVVPDPGFQPSSLHGLAMAMAMAIMMATFLQFHSKYNPISLTRSSILAEMCTRTCSPIRAQARRQVADQEDRMQGQNTPYGVDMLESPFSIRVRVRVRVRVRQATSSPPLPASHVRIYEVNINNLLSGTDARSPFSNEAINQLSPSLLVRVGCTAHLSHPYRIQRGCDLRSVPFESGLKPSRLLQGTEMRFVPDPLTLARMRDFQITQPCRAIFTGRHSLCSRLFDHDLFLRRPRSCILCERICVCAVYSARMEWNFEKPCRLGRKPATLKKFGTVRLSTSAPLAPLNRKLWTRCVIISHLQRNGLTSNSLRPVHVYSNVTSWRLSE